MLKTFQGRQINDVIPLVLILPNSFPNVAVKPADSPYFILCIQRATGDVLQMACQASSLSSCLLEGWLASSLVIAD